MKYLIKVFFILFFLFFFHSVYADSLTGLFVEVDSDGDIPSISIGCTENRSYTLTFTNNTDSYLIGPIQRLRCGSSGFITFDALNLNTFLTNTFGATWWSFVHTPIYYVVKDTTSQGGCDTSSCGLFGLPNASNSYDQFANNPNNTDFETIGAGPIFDTTDNISWFNVSNGDGTANFTPVSNILFLPGVEASRLYRGGCPDEGGGEHRLWEPFGSQDVRDLFLDENGKSVSPLLPEYGVYTRDVVDEAYLPVVGPNIYKSFLNELDTMKSVDHTIEDYSAVAYDWRLSLDDILNNGIKTGDNISYADISSESYIFSELERLASSSPTGKVTIIAHSNGGLVTKALMQKLSDTNSPLLQKVDKIIFVAVPQLGTPQAIIALLHGYDQGIPSPFPFIMSESLAREFSHNLPSVYNLLPSANYFTYIDTPVVTFDSSVSNWSSVYGDVVHSQERLHNFLTDSFERVDPSSSNVYSPDKLSDQLLSNAESLHTILDNWTPPTGVEVIEIAGWGVPSTMSGIEYKKETCFRISCGFLSKTITPEPQWTIDGDGTVVTPSALWMGGNEVSRYWVDLKRYNIDSSINTGLGLFPFNHKSILEVDQLLDFIKSIIKHQPVNILPQYISNITPIAYAGDSRLIYELHSPLALNIYDDTGRHTGFSTTTGRTEENIPGTYFDTVGDFQYVFTTSSSTNKIIINGDSNKAASSKDNPGGGGSSYVPFTFKIEQFSGDALVASTTFADISSTSSTTATITINGNDISIPSPLIVDLNSSGNSDFVLLSKPNDTVTIPGVVSGTTDNIVSTNNVQISGGNGPIIPKPSVYIVSSTTTEDILPPILTPIPSSTPMLQQEDSIIPNKEKIIKNVVPINELPQLDPVSTTTAESSDILLAQVSKSNIDLFSSLIDF